MNVVAHNLLAMNANRMLNLSTSSKAKTTEKLSSGYRINRAADDAAGLAVSEKMRWMIRGLSQGTQNTQDGISFVQIGDGAMSQIHDMLHRIEELSVKAANETLTDDDRLAIDAEVQQLKSQINEINKHTVFNELPVFENGSMVSVEGVPSDMTLFDAEYDDATKQGKYGGFIFHGNRVAWNQVDANMVDPATGLFTGGTYDYSYGGTTFHITTKKDGTVPEMTRRFSVSASATGISIDGKTFGWDEVYDEYGEEASVNNAHNGNWFFDYEGAEINLYLEEIDSFEDMQKEISRLMDDTLSTHYVWEQEYVGDEEQKAVDVNGNVQVNISQTLANQIYNDPSTAFVIRVDQTGIFLEDQTGTEYTGSKKTWADLGIHSFDSGTDISDNRTYRYSYVDSGKEVLGFNFYLNDVTSVDSIIDGLYGVKIAADTLKTNYSTSVTNSASDVQFSATARLNVDFREEYELGRPFDQKLSDVASQAVSYDATNKQASLVFAHGGTDVITLSGSTSSAQAQLENKMQNYFDTVAEIKEKSMILGTPYVPKTLVDLVGASNITQAGYFDQTVTLTSSMNLSAGKPGTHAAPGTAGHTYAAAMIDFANLTSDAMVKELAGTGFDSTCKTCSNHYSIQFVDSLAGGMTTAEGYRYKKEQNGLNYTLKIDVNSLAANGVDDGTDVANAIVKLASNTFDFHYTQYAAEGSKLYVYDNREQNTPAQAAQFWTAPYDAENIANMSVSLRDQSNDGGYVNLKYRYDLTNLAAGAVEAKEVANGAGKYVKNSDLSGNPSQVGYSEYNSTMDGRGLQRYDIVTVYKDANGNGTTKAAAVASNTKQVMDTLLTKTDVTMKTNDYTKMTSRFDEKANVCLAPVYETNVYKVGEDEGIDIFHSGIKGDKTTIPRFSMSTVALGMARANTRTASAAGKAIDYVKKANEHVSHKRAIYGAMQNRLEHTMQNNQNKEENMTAAESRIRDTDMAKTMVSYSNNEIVRQAAQSMLSQANQANQTVLGLLQ